MKEIYKPSPEQFKLRGSAKCFSPFTEVLKSSSEAEHHTSWMLTVFHRHTSSFLIRSVLCTAQIIHINTEAIAFILRLDLGTT